MGKEKSVIRRQPPSNFGTTPIDEMRKEAKLKMGLRFFPGKFPCLTYSKFLVQTARQIANSLYVDLCNVDECLGQALLIVEMLRVV
jgi:hypothetical protein